MKACAKLGVLLLCALAPAQEIERRIGTYKVATSYEFGYRSVFVGGNRDSYRSAVNYNNGLRLFDGMLRLYSGDGHGRFVDEIVLTTFGSGGDPYQANSLRLEKNRYYRLDMGFRIVNYYNHLLALSGGEHRFNTERIFQNYDLTLFPTRRVQLLIGYDRNNQNGPALTSQEIDVRGEPAFPRDRFFVFADKLRRQNNLWRVGGNVTAGPVKISLMQSWDIFKEDPINSLDAARQEPTTGLIAQSFRRSDPVHGVTPFSRLNIHTDANRLFSINGRVVYSGGDRNFVLDENIASLNPTSSVLVTRQNYVLGRGRRNQGTGDLTLGFQPVEHLAFSNTTSINQTRITGDSAFVELRTPASLLDPGRNEYYFDFLGIRLITNATNVNFRPTRTLGFYGGYHYSIRRIQSREILEDISGAPTGVPLDSFENTMHSGLAGIRVSPLPAFSALFDVEYGRADRPFTPVSEKNFHAETLRAQWKHKTWLLTGSFKKYHNRNNPPPVLGELEGAPTSGHSYDSRQYSAGLSWTPPKRYAFDAGYSKLHLDTASGIVNFPLPDAGTSTVGRRSLYISNLHHVNGTLRIELPRGTILFLGYSLVKDTADGRSRPTYTPPFAPSYPNFVFNGTDLITVYPLNYQSPQAKLSFRLNKKLSWNAGWQYFGYAEKFSGLENYSAHMATTSFRWSF